MPNNKYVVLGTTGHIGSALTQLLLAPGQAVTIISHDPQKAQHLQQKGARLAVADAHEAEALRRAFGQGKRLFLLNPPASPTTDTVAEERRTLAAIVAALPGSGPHWGGPTRQPIPSCA